MQVFYIKVNDVCCAGTRYRTSRQSTYDMQVLYVKVTDV